MNNQISTADLKKMLCVNHTGKMHGMQSLSSSSAVNAFCIKRAKNGDSICAKCFSNTMQKRYTTLARKLVRNTEILTADVYPVEMWPLLNVRLFRLESFGDLNPGAAGVTQFANYCNFAARNPGTTFALWTKNTVVINKAIRDGIAVKPENMIIIQSSPLINKAIAKPAANVDKVFTVYTNDDSATAAGVEINCGARSCLSCQRCYTKTDSVEYVNELLK